LAEENDDSASKSSKKIKGFPAFQQQNVQMIIVFNCRRGESTGLSIK
jgi:hypothetical protein